MQNGNHEEHPELNKQTHLTGQAKGKKMQDTTGCGSPHFGIWPALPALVRLDYITMLIIL